MTSICLRSVGVSGRDRLSTFIEVIFRDENGAGLLLPTELYKHLFKNPINTKVVCLRRLTLIPVQPTQTHKETQK